MQRVGATIDLTPPKPAKPRYPAYFGLLLSLVITLALAQLYLFWYIDQNFQQREARIQQIEQETFTRRLEAEIILQGQRHKAKSSSEAEVDNEQAELITQIDDSIIPRLFTRPSLVEQLFFDYLDRYAGLDLSKPKPCDPELKALYNGAETLLDAIFIAALELGGTNTYTLFVERRRAEISIRPYSEESDCSAPIAAEDTQPETTKEQP